MAKQGMKRIDRTHTNLRNEVAPVPEIQGKAKHTKEKANPIIAGTVPPHQKVYHNKPHSLEKPISSVYPVIDTDVARDNLENDLKLDDLENLLILAWTLLKEECTSPLIGKVQPNGYH